MSDERIPAGQSPRTWTVLSLIEWSRDHLAGRGFEEARLHAELMLAHALRINRLQLYLQFDRPLDAAELAAYRELFKRRLTHEPLQYILGETGFMGLTLGVGPGVLIPRPETELLVERALARIRACARTPVAVLDVGCGSGNIALALVHHGTGLQVTAIDVSDAAIARCRDNAERLQTTGVEWICGDVFDVSVMARRFDFIVSNPPYISREEYEDLVPEVRLFEPRQALTDENDGFAFLRRLAPRAAQLLAPGGVFLCEIGYGQEAGARDACAEGGFTRVTVHADYAGIPRIVEADRV
jgi:release factor glutamine methyltransferase